MPIWSGRHPRRPCEHAQAARVEDARVWERTCVRVGGSAAPVVPGFRVVRRTHVPDRGSCQCWSSVFPVLVGKVLGGDVASDGSALAGVCCSGGAMGTTRTSPATSAHISQCAGGLAG